MGLADAQDASSIMRKRRENYNILPVVENAITEGRSRIMKREVIYGQFNDPHPSTNRSCSEQESLSSGGV